MGTVNEAQLVGTNLTLYRLDIIMSKINDSRVIKVPTAAALVTADQFNAALDAIKDNGVSTQGSIKTAVNYIMQQTGYKAQQDAIKALSKVYVAFKKLIGDDITPARAARWIARQIKAANPKYKMLKSESASAKAKAKQRAARMTKGKAEVKAEKKPAAKPESSIAQFRNALIEKEIKLQQEFRGVIPAGKVKDFDQAFAAFISTIEMILK